RCRSLRASHARGGTRARGAIEGTMKIFEPHVHMASRVTDDYERMALAGIVAVCEPAFWQGQPRTSLGTFVDYFDLLLGFERYRASQYGIRHVCTLALNPKEANDGRVNQALIDATRADTVQLRVETGRCSGLSIYPATRRPEERVGAIFERYGVARMIISSAADWGRSDPLKVPRTIMHLRARGFPEAAIETLVWTNPVAFFSQTGRLDPAELEQPM